MTRALAGVAAGTALLALGATAAAAHPIDDRDHRIYIADEQPPPPPPAPRPPKKPLPTSLGFRFGFTFAGPSSGIGMGLQGGLELSRSLRAVAEYEYIILLSADDDEPAPPPGSPRMADGRGHRGRVGMRVNLADTSLKGSIRFYADADATAGLALVHGPARGARLVPEMALGLRLGYELMPRLESPSKTYDAHLLLRFVRTPDDTGVTFGVGMEWGSGPKT